MKTIPWMSRCAGLNVLVDPTRIEYDPEKGIAELGAAVNIDIDRTGRISRRKGYARISTGNIHSLWSDGDRAFYVSGRSLYEFFQGWTSRGLRSNLQSDGRMSFVNGGGNIYYSNGVDNGVIRDDTSYTWIGSAYVGPETIKVISLIPPVGHLLEIHNAYMLIAQDNILYHSMPFAFSHYRLSSDFSALESRITMVKSLGVGVWVSCNNGVWWLDSSDPGSWKRQKKSDVAAIEGTACVIDTSSVGVQGIGDMAVIWTANDGIILGDDKGNVFNLTEDKLIYPSSSAGSGVVIKDKYVVTLRP